MAQTQKIFKSTDDHHAKFNGAVTIVRQLTKDEADDEVGPMYRCMTPGGEVFDAFSDELSEA